MITRNYVKILGREPNQNDLTYFLNAGIKEEDLVKKMLESQEHADLIKSRQEVLQTKQSLKDHQLELMQLRAATADQKGIIENLSASVAQKNYALSKMHYTLTMLQRSQASGTATNPELNNPKYKGTFLDKLFKAFSDLFE